MRQFRPGTCRLLEAVHLLQQVVVVADVCLLVTEHDAVQVREVPVQVHAVIIVAPNQVVFATL